MQSWVLISIHPARSEAASLCDQRHQRIVVRVMQHLESLTVTIAHWSLLRMGQRYVYRFGCLFLLWVGIATGRDRKPGHSGEKSSEIV